MHDAPLSEATEQPVASMDDLAARVDLSLLTALTPDPDATCDGVDHTARQVFSGHYVPVRPTPLPSPTLVAHSPTLFADLGLSDTLVRDPAFQRFFSADLTDAPPPLPDTGWATGYALSIYGQEYVQQCPFGTGNGYGDGRALSVCEGVFRGRRWEMQLKGAGPTPYCRGGDGRAVLRSSVREFLAQEHLHALGVPTTRSLCLFASTTERIQRPWYRPGSRSTDPDRWVADPAAITTRVASSFLRVGQLELFARRARDDAHPTAHAELEQLLRHVVEREYREEILPDQPLGAQFVQVARAFRARLIHLVTAWLRVGYCQGNFNGDNCSLGGVTLDFGPFGLMERFDPAFQPWTGGGRHFAFLNQPQAAERNYEAFCRALRIWPGFSASERQALDALQEGFASAMQASVLAMFADKLGLPEPNGRLVQDLLDLVERSRADYTLVFRALCGLPTTLEPLRAAFYAPRATGWTWPRSTVDEAAWGTWIAAWRAALRLGADGRAAEDVAASMKRVDPVFVLREWQLASAYEAAATGDHAGVRELQRVMTRPYDSQEPETRRRFAVRRPEALFGVGGIAHMSCSS